MMEIFDRLLVVIVVFAWCSILVRVLALILGIPIVAFRPLRLCRPMFPLHCWIFLVWHVVTLICASILYALHHMGNVDSRWLACCVILSSKVIDVIKATLSNVS